METARSKNDFDFIDQQLIVQTSVGHSGRIALQPQSVATFYSSLMAELDKLDFHVDIHRVPNEISDPIPFDEDETHRAYDGAYAHRFWRILVQVDRVFEQFRARFIGKCSPVHFSGVRRIWPSPGFPDDRRQNIPAEFPIYRTGSHGKPIRRKSVAADSGLAAVRFLTRLSIRMRTPLRLTSQRHPYSRKGRSSVTICMNFFFPTIWSGSQHRRMILFSNSCKRPMKQQPIWPTGIAPLWNEAVTLSVRVNPRLLRTGE